MINQIFSVFDLKAQAYCHPFYAASSVVAIRHFSNAASDPASALSCNPEDYVLMLLGSFNDESGEIIPFAVQGNLGTASKLQKESQA